MQVCIGRGKVVFHQGLCSCVKVYAELGENRLEKTASGGHILMTENLLYQMASSGAWEALEDSEGVILGQRGIQIYIPYDQKQ